MEFRIRESQGAYHQLHAYCVQMGESATAVERNLMLERSKVNELELRMSSLNSINGALLHHVVAKELQPQDESRGHPVSIQQPPLRTSSSRINLKA